MAEKPITCGKCKTESVPNKGRGLCPACYLAEYKAGRIESWELNKKKRRGMMKLPMAEVKRIAREVIGPIDGLPLPSPSTPAPTTPPRTLTLKFQGPDLEILDRLTRAAEKARRTPEGQVLCWLEAQLAAAVGAPAA